MKQTLRSVTAWLVRLTRSVACTTYGDIAQLSDGPCQRCVGRSIHGPAWDLSQHAASPQPVPAQDPTKPVAGDEQQGPSDEFDGVDKQGEPMYASAPTAPPAQAGEDARDAARYRWLRHGDNDESVMKVRGSSKLMDVWLLRTTELDTAIDAAIAAEERKP